MKLKTIRFYKGIILIIKTVKHVFTDVFQNKKKTIRVYCTSFALLLLFLPFNNCSPGHISSAKASLNNSPTDSGSLGSVPTNLPIIPPVSAGKVDVFMAFGKMGRTIMSCDDGVTWINDRSDDDAARCWTPGPTNVDCDHNQYSSTGLDSGADGWFYTQYGWGSAGTVRRSRNGVNWEVVRSGDWGGGLAVANNHVVQIWESGWSVSTDNGTNWNLIPGSQWSGPLVFDHTFIKRAGQKLFARGRGNGQLAVSTDAGATWKVSAGFDSSWGGSFAEGNGIIVSNGVKEVSGQNPVSYSARSTDNGLTWTAVTVIPAGRWSSNIIFNGTHFMNWSTGTMYKSTDGIIWTSQPYSPYFEGTVSYNPRTKTYMAVHFNWGSWYDKQYALRSKDGINWTVLDQTHFHGGHPITGIITGEMDASACGK